jgi:hypothetical protein
VRQKQYRGKQQTNRVVVVQISKEAHERIRELAAQRQERIGVLSTRLMDFALDNYPAADLAAKEKSGSQLDELERRVAALEARLAEQR